MATYAIGDIQGCYHAFQDLLARLNFNSNVDQLWLVGDIINRGSGSLEVLRWCYAHQDHIQIVLGNHDLHALVVAHGIRRANKRDTLQSIFEAKDSSDLLNWLRHQPLMFANEQYVMVHAGLMPQWHLKEALIYAKEVEHALQSDAYVDFLTHMYGNTPNVWQDKLAGYDRLRVITNSMTRMRACTAAGVMDFEFKGELKDMPAEYMPWFDVPTRKTSAARVVCGHWSALGLHQRDNVYALDTGCLWGGMLTAMCSENIAITQVPSNIKDTPLTLRS